MQLSEPQSQYIPSVENAETSAQSEDSSRSYNEILRAHPALRAELDMVRTELHKLLSVKYNIQLDSWLMIQSLWKNSLLSIAHSFNLLKPASTRLQENEGYADARKVAQGFEKKISKEYKGRSEMLARIGRTEHHASVIRSKSGVIAELGVLVSLQNIFGSANVRSSTHAEDRNCVDVVVARDEKTKFLIQVKSRLHTESSLQVELPSSDIKARMLKTINHRDGTYTTGCLHIVYTRNIRDQGSLFDPFLGLPVSQEAVTLLERDIAKVIL